ncbi:hypothetical protein [Methylobacterium sp. CM6247]
MNEQNTGEVEPQMLDVVDRLIAEAEVRHIEWVAHLRALIACGERSTEAMRVLVEIEGDPVRLNDQRIGLLSPEPMA